MENIVKHNMLVDALGEKIKQNYEVSKNQYYNELISIKKDNLKDEDYMQNLSIYNIVLYWVKEKLIDNDFSYFRLFKEAKGNTANYYIDRECIEILLNDKTNFIVMIRSLIYVNNIYSVNNVMMWLLSLNENTIGYSLVSALDRSIYNKNKSDKEG